jgi:hypothetical protein
MVPVDEDGMCPNCQTPWKCNGPHEPEMRQQGTECAWCLVGDWPCDAIREADRADKAEAALAECKAEWERRCSLANQIGLDWMYDAKAARADAKALAEVVETLHRGDAHDDPDGYCRACEVIAAHKEATE